MPRVPRYAIVFAPEVIGHLDSIQQREIRSFRETLVEQLTFSPEVRTRNRKPLELPAPFGATWELRFGPANRYRVFYEVERTAKVVQVLAVGIKERNKLYIAGQEFES